MTGVLIKEGNLETDMYTGKCHEKMKIEFRLILLPTRILLTGLKRDQP